MCTEFSVQEDILAEVGKAEGDSGAYLEQISRSGSSIPRVVQCCRPGRGLLPLLWLCHSSFCGQVKTYSHCSGCLSNPALNLPVHSTITSQMMPLWGEPERVHV